MAGNIMSPTDIKVPKDLEGQALAMASGSAQFAQWPAFAKGAGIDLDKVKLISLDPAGVTTALLTKQVPAIGGFAQGYVPSIEIRGKKEARIFWYADQGVTVISNGIVVHADLLKSDPGLVKAFVPPSIKGFLYARAHPEEAIAILKTYSDAITPEITMREMEFSWKTWVTQSTRGKPLGWAAPSDWQATVDVLKKYGGVTTPLDAEQIYTNEFVPTGAEYLPPQEA
jgi:NitT/TauT family transport system substrate-binding protein